MKTRAVLKKVIDSICLDLTFSNKIVFGAVFNTYHN